MDDDTSNRDRYLGGIGVRRGSFQILNYSFLIER